MNVDVNKKENKRKRGELMANEERIILKDIIRQIRSRVVIKKTARTFAAKEQRIRKSTKSELLLLMR